MRKLDTKGEKMSCLRLLCLCGLVLGFVPSLSAESQPHLCPILAALQWMKEQMSQRMNPGFPLPGVMEGGGRAWVELEEGKVTGTWMCCTGRGSLLFCSVGSGCPLPLLSLAPWFEGLSGANGVGVHEAGCFMTDPKLPQEGPEARAITPDMALWMWGLTPLDLTWGLVFPDRMRSQVRQSACQVFGIDVARAVSFLASHQERWRDTFGWWAWGQHVKDGRMGR